MADWKKELKGAYDKSAAEKVNESNQSFRKEMAQAMASGIAKGMGRSSYAAQTVANLETDMEEAGNRIRTDFSLEYLKALREREMQEQQLELERQKLAEQKRQFDLQMSANAAGGGYGGGGYGGNRGGGVPNNNTGNTQTAADLARTLKEISDLKNANAAAYANRNNFRGGGLKTNSLMTR